MLIRLFVFLGLFQTSILVNAQDYYAYHAACREIENILLVQKWEEALEGYRRLERDFDFLFKKDLKIALQLAYRTRDSTSFRSFSEEAFARGWKWKRAKKELKINPDFASGMKKELKSFAKKAEPPVFLYPDVREKVKRLFVQDQWQALGALFTFSPEKQDRYAERKIAPKARDRVEKIQEIINQIGYPGEMLIGNSIWSSTIFSHYNSISEKFVKEDTLYPVLRESLRKELGLGRISPFEFAIIDNWYQSIVSDRKIESYGILEGEVSEDAIKEVDANRLSVGLPTVDQYNRLLDLQSKSGIRLFFSEAWGANSSIGVKK
jgi:hypothetical protein